jgi:MFS transporter, Spinster family, sphingosine-1-phosphate transporter
VTGRVRATQILVVLALANLVGYAARNALLAVYPDLEARFGIADAELGLLQTAFMIPHAVATLGFGWAGDRFPRKRVIAAGLLVASLAGGAGAFGESYLGFALSRALVGFGTAAIVPVANSIVGQIFDGPRKASRLAIFNLGLFVGGVVGFGAGAALGFPVVVTAIAIPGIVLSAAVLALDIPPRLVLPRATLATERHGLRLGAALEELARDARELATTRTLRWVILSTTLMAFAAGGFGAWFPEFLRREKGMSEEAAASLFGLALLGGLSGIFVGARLADRLRDRITAGRMWTIVIGMTLATPCAAVAIVLPAGLALDIVGVATLFFISWYHAPMAATVDDLASPRVSVSAQGLVIFTMHLFGTAPSAWVVGLVSERSSIATALWVPTGALVLAAACMAIGTTSFAADAARHGTPARPSL